MASRTAACALSLAGTIGSRTILAHLPSSDSAYLTGAGEVSTKRLMCSGASLSCSFRAAAKSPRRQAPWNSAHSRGATLEVTEMQPWPPCAMKPSAVPSSPESWLKPSPMAARCCETRTMLAVVLDAGDVLELVEPRHRLDRHVDHRACRDVVDDDRNADRVVDRLEVLVHPFLGR